MDKVYGGIIKMSCGAFTEIQFVLNELIHDNLKNKRILDVGCGYGFFGWVLKAHKKGNPYIVGIDINKERLNKTREIGMYNYLIWEDVREWNPFEKYDLIIVSHIIEHLPKEDGINLIIKLKKYCKGTMIVTCPYGDTRADLNIDDPIHDQHISIWIDQDLIKLGFKTRHMRFSHRAGRVVSLFERLWFWIKRIKRGGVLIGWLDECS